MDRAQVLGERDHAAAEVPPVIALALLMSSNTKSSFFRQGSWMVIATFVGGLFMAGVQFEAPHVMEKSDFNTFIALLRMLMLFGLVPSAALQTIFAQQSAAALTDETKAELTTSVRTLLKTTFVLWVALAGAVLVFARPISQAFRVNNPEALRVTVLAVLAVVWGPTFKGLLQGLHRFAPLGWLATIEGIVRLAAFLLLVKWLKGGSAGGVWAVFIGQYLILAIAIWVTRDVWTSKTRGS
jgi:O-antigen/teichoic acid export membrane protein